MTGESMRAITPRGVNQDFQTIVAGANGPPAGPEAEKPPAGVTASSPAGAMESAAPRVVLPMPLVVLVKVSDPDCAPTGSAFAAALKETLAEQFAEADELSARIQKKLEEVVSNG